MNTTHTPVPSTQDAKDGLRRIGAEHDAMKMALDLIAAGVAEIRDNNMLMFDEVPGGIFPLADTWTATINAIGWGRCVAALAGKGVG